MEKQFVTYYTFTHQTPMDDDPSGSFPIQTSSQKSITMSDGTGWPAIVREFTNFLSGIYGYNISEQVFVKEHTWDGDESKYESIQDYGV